MYRNFFLFTKSLYDKWNIHIFVLLSLLLQTILILFASFRKRTGRSWVIFLLWIAYLLADWAANFAVGLISNSQKGAIRKSKQLPDVHADILAFWAPFLLLHLGGPDTITAFSLEDNALWQRHLVGLISQVAAAVIVFYQSFPRNTLWLPTVFMFLAGTIKYGERTRALYLANLDQFRKSMLKDPDPGPNYAKVMAEYSKKKEAKLPTQIELIPEPNRESKTARSLVEGELNDLQVVKHAYDFYNTFRGLIVDLIFSFRERDESKLFFHGRTPTEAFDVLATELNFMYEVLYTKVHVVHSVFGYIVRFISWCAVVAALSKFYSLDKPNFHKIDIGITYSLLFGAICLDTIALFMIVLSDWTANSIQNSKCSVWMGPLKNCFQHLLERFASLKKIKWPDRPTGGWIWDTQIFFRRWAGKMHTHNLISYCIKEVPKQNSASRVLDFVIDQLGLKDMYDRIRYVEDVRLMKDQWQFIFFELKKKSDLADDPEIAKRICSARGNFAIEDSNLDDNIKKKLMNYVVDVDYDQSLMIWHIATELCCQTLKPKETELCKMLSDYMLYLLVMQPTMMSVVAGIGEIRFRDTCAEAKRFFLECEPSLRKEEKDKKEMKKKKACQMILGINTDVKPVALKGDRSKSVLFDACILAKLLKELKEEEMWEVMNKVWVELLSYAASHCRASAHAAQLSKGGELITFVWLLMAHFGIGEQFQIKEGHARAKLIVGK